ncbi:hypothetical protein MMC08_008369 [Hypocenomyce scalaris]|nr:hypothetical protein [Hypocenomyce scalaris]
MAANENIEKSAASNGNPLSRQVTVQMSPEQYERVFFQPTPARGDLARRLGNPTLLGVLGFLIPFNTTILCLLQLRGSGPSSFTGVSGAYYFLGGIAMNLAGIGEFILGNTFPFAVFCIYGCHWCQIAYSEDPVQGIVASYGVGAAGADNVSYNSGQGMYNVTMALVSFVLFLGAVRTNVPFALAIFCLIFLFSFIAAADFATPYATTAAEGAHVLMLLRVAGGFGMVTALSGWYLAISLACASTGVLCPLPALDLAHVIFPGTKAAAIEGGGAAV